MAFDRDSELKAFFALRLKLLRVHYFNPKAVMCSCNKENCEHVGKHPMSSRGVWGARAYENAQQIGNCNIGVMCGEDVVVLDVDKNHGGVELFAQLCDHYGGLPRTWTVATGGGGFHYYFKPRTVPMRPGVALKASGIELKGWGGYVLAPTSIHKSGRYYEWEVSPDDVELADIPDWVIEKCTNKADVYEHKTAESNLLEIYSEKDVLEALGYLPSSCTYDEWVRVGMALKASGFSIDFWDNWSRTSADKYPGFQLIEKKWNSFKGATVTAATLFFLAREKGWQPARTECVYVPDEECVDTCEQVEEQTKPCNVIEAPFPKRRELVPPEYPEGPIGELAEVITESALYKHKLFGMASAIATFSALVQGSYVSPLRRGYLGTYTIFVAGASAGKEHYSSRVVECVRKCAPWLVTGTPASPQALRADLHECNSRLIAMDEALRWLQTTMESRNAADKNLISDVMSIWGMSHALLPGIRTKSKENCSPEIENPHLTIVGCGTSEKLDTLLRRSPSFVQDGTLSRFDFVMSETKSPDSFLNRPEFVLTMELERLMRKIVGQEAHDSEIDTATRVKLDRRVYDKPRVVAWADAQAAEAWNDIAVGWSNRAAVAADAIATSVWNRGAEKALRTATLLAIAANPAEPAVTVADVLWGATWQEYLCETMSGLADCRVGQTPQGEIEAAIVDTARRTGDRTLARLAQHSRVLRNAPHQTLQAAIAALQDRGVLVARRSQRGATKASVPGVRFDFVVDLD
jgi:hypothetical protein